MELSNRDRDKIQRGFERGRGGKLIEKKAYWLPPTLCVE